MDYFEKKKNNQKKKWNSTPQHMHIIAEMGMTKLCAPSFLCFMRVHVMYSHMRLYTYMCTYTCMYTHVCIHTCVYIHVYVHMYVYSRMCEYMTCTRMKHKKLGAQSLVMPISAIMCMCCGVLFHFFFWLFFFFSK